MQCPRVFESRRGPYWLVAWLLGATVVSALERKTGTTIAGVCFDGGIVLAADSRATEATLIADPTYSKIHRLADHVWACGAGSCADAERLARHARLDALLERRRLRAVRGEADGAQPTVALLASLARRRLNLARLECHLIVGGVDRDGAHLCSIGADGALLRDLDYIADGSGSLAATSTLALRYRRGLGRDAAVEAACEAVSAGIRADTGSGGRVDIVVIDGISVSQFSTDGTKVPSPRRTAAAERTENDPTGASALIATTDEDAPSSDGSSPDRDPSTATRDEPA
ncbi:nucleophile aminohydrolase [Pelagophyceae sp. CCMP2097]|nr:nucleophile aminohydrolase [Pelagophyceae sp. CCMP2097]